MSVEPPLVQRPELTATLRALAPQRAIERTRELQELRLECARLRREPVALRAELHQSALQFRNGNGSKWCGFSSLRDYASERLGVAPSTFYRWAKSAGELLSVAPPDLLDPPDLPDPLALSDLPGPSGPRSGEATGQHPEACITTGNPDATQHFLVRLRVDSRFAPYLRDTLRLAGALIGSDVDEETQLAAVLAEASSEVDVTVSALEAARRLGFSARRRPPQPASTKSKASLAEPKTGFTESLAGSTDSKTSPSFGLNVPRAALNRQESHALDLRLRRLIARRRRMRRRHEARLLQFHDASIHARLGYRRFDKFAHAELGLSSSTVFEMLNRARLDRQEHPIAVAQATGRIGTLQASMLHRIWRMGVPRSDLPRWINLASRITVRSLRDRVAWARQQSDSDYRAWSLRGCPPPSDEELRTTRHLLRTLADNPAPHALLEQGKLPWKRRANFQWILDEESAAFFAQLIVSIQDRALRDGHGICEDWRALIILCHHARRAWSQLERPRSRREESVLDRDDWRCSVPGCSSRRSLQRHHIRFAGRGGGNEDENLVTLCAFHHLIGVHQGILTIRGRAERGSEDLCFDLGLRPGGRPLLRFRGEHHLRRNSWQPGISKQQPAAPKPTLLREPRARYSTQTLPQAPSWAMLRRATPSQRLAPCPSGISSG